MRAIERCRTPALGGQVYACTACGVTRYSYHSCRNRHCPKCQHEQTQEWLEVQQGLLLPVPYFLLTFTLPAELRQTASQNQKLIYNLLFRASAQATQQLARDPRLVGGQIGMVGVLHTWTRNLAYHPHVHYLVPGGGLSADGLSWLPVQHNFFLPVKALSKLFRAAFRRALRRTPLYAPISPKVWQREWVVHCKPVGNGQAALKYLAPYIHRVALSNRRLVSIDHRGSMETSQVTFQYRTSDTGQLKTCTLPVERFIHRFLQHVLPRGFVKVRYFGFFGASLRPQLLALQQKLEQNQPIDNALTPPDPHQETISPAPQRITSAGCAPTSLPCPKCGQPMLFQRALAPTTCRSP